MGVFEGVKVLVAEEVAVGVTVGEELAVMLPVKERLALLEADAPCVKLAEGLLDTVVLLLTVDEGVTADVAVPLVLELAVGVLVGVAAAEPLPLSEMLGVMDEEAP